MPDFQAVRAAGLFVWLDVVGDDMGHIRHVLGQLIAGGPDDAGAAVHWIAGITHNWSAPEG
jgi:hypothetical protein